MKQGPPLWNAVRPGPGPDIQHIADSEKLPRSGPVRAKCSTGFELNLGKCVLMFHMQFDTATVHAAFQRSGLDVFALKLSDSGKYLDIYIGLRISQILGAALGKLEERTHMVGALGLNVVHSVVAWNWHAAPAAGHVAQLLDPPCTAEAVESEYHQHFTRAPRFSVLPLELKRDSLHFDVKFRSLAAAARSAQGRTKLLSGDLDDQQRWLEDLWRTGEVTLGCLTDPYHRDSIL
eukprot:1189751-Pyramimonas_sp.AAC.1